MYADDTSIIVLNIEVSELSSKILLSLFKFCGSGTDNNLITDVSFILNRLYFAKTLRLTCSLWVYKFITV